MPRKLVHGLNEVATSPRTVRLPKHVDPGGTRGEDALDTHTSEIIQLGRESSEIATKPEARLPPIPLERGPKEIVIGWVSIGELVHQNRVVGEPPVVWRRPVARREEIGVIIQWRLGVLIRV